MADSPTISFASLQYDVSGIEQLIADNPTIDSFVFASIFPLSGDSMQLVAYIHLNEPNSRYDKSYDTLAVYDEKPLTVPGPVLMCDNVLPIESMRAAIINAENVKADFLVFTPGINGAQYLYYTISSYQYGVGGSRPIRVHGDDTFITNPSPPAT